MPVDVFRCVAVCMLLNQHVQALDDRIACTCLSASAFCAQDSSPPVWAQLLQRCVRSSVVGRKAAQQLLALQTGAEQVLSYVWPLRFEVNSASQVCAIATAGRQAGRTQYMRRCSVCLLPLICYLQHVHTLLISMCAPLMVQHSPTAAC
jgi:hypothetical protein